MQLMRTYQEPAPEAGPGDWWTYMEEVLRSPPLPALPARRCSTSNPSMHCSADRDPHPLHGIALLLCGCASSETEAGYSHGVHAGGAKRSGQALCGVTGAHRGWPTWCRRAGRTAARGLH